MKAKDCIPLYLLPMPEQYADAVVHSTEFHRTGKWWAKFEADEVGLMRANEDATSGDADMVIAVVLDAARHLFVARYEAGRWAQTPIPLDMGDVWVELAS